MDQVSADRVHLVAIEHGFERNHPAILERYLDGTLFDKKGVKWARPGRWFSEDERKLLALLKRIRCRLLKNTLT